MTRLVDTDMTDNAPLSKNSNSPFDRALFDAKDFREFSGCCSLPEADASPNSSGHHPTQQAHFHHGFNAVSGTT